jgi:hypothetical protein
LADGRQLKEWKKNDGSAEAKESPSEPTPPGIDGDAGERGGSAGSVRIGWDEGEGGAGEADDEDMMEDKDGSAYCRGEAENEGDEDTREESCGDIPRTPCSS